MKYCTFNINTAKEYLKDCYYFMNTGKRRSSIFNLFLPDNLKDSTDNEESKEETL